MKDVVSHLLCNLNNSRSHKRSRFLTDSYL